MEKLKLLYPVVVEGKYDKIKLDAVVESPIFVLDGFSFFKNNDKKKLFSAYAKNGVIVLTDSDKAGGFIRSKLKGYTSGNIINLYSPVISGKEKRKSSPSKDGIIGVEGIDTKTLYALLKPFESKEASVCFLTRQRLYADGLSGKPNSVKLRNALLAILGLPIGLTSSAFCDAINSMFSEAEYQNALKLAREETQN